MEKSMFVTPETIEKDFGISRTKAYEIIRDLNQELKEKGFLTVPGRVSKKFYHERIYGYHGEQ